MSFKEFWQLLSQKYWLIIISIIVIVAGVAYYNSIIKNTYEGNIGFSVVRLGKSQANEFSDYYATQADSLVTTNFVKWLLSKPFTASVYQSAGIDLDNENLDKIIKKTEVVKISGADIAYRFETYQEDRAEEIGAAVIKKVGERTTQIKKNAKTDVNARALEVSSKLTIHQKTTNQKLNYLLGFIGGMILGFVILLAIRYFSPRKR